MDALASPETRGALIIRRDDPPPDAPATTGAVVKRWAFWGAIIRGVFLPLGYFIVESIVYASSEHGAYEEVGYGIAFGLGLFIAVVMPIGAVFGAATGALTATILRSLPRK